MGHRRRFGTGWRRIPKVNQFNTKPIGPKILESLKKRRAKTLILLAAIWFAVAIPMPFLFNVPGEATRQFYTLIQILGFISIPFVALGIAWTLKPELAQ